jgi:hypothetical protein
MGEIANLLWLFANDREALADWKTCDRRTRMKKYAPAAVRRALKSISPDMPFIEEDRYKALCEVGTHPVPAFRPGHYSGSGRPVLGMYFQAPGYAMCVNELGFALAMAATPALTLLDIPKELRETAADVALDLLRSLGSMTILNYEEYIAKAKANAIAKQSAEKGAEAGDAT